MLKQAMSDSGIDRSISMDLDIHHSHAVSADNRGLPPLKTLQRFHNSMDLSGLTDLCIILMTTPGMYRFRNA